MQNLTPNMMFSERSNCLKQYSLPTNAGQYIEAPLCELIEAQTGRKKKLSPVA